MRQPLIGVVDYGAGNLASVLRALTYVGARTRVVDSGRHLGGLDALVLPGVGSFTAALEHLERRGIVGDIVNWAWSDRPLLGICLGMHLLAQGGTEGSTSSGDTAGLAVFAGRVRRMVAAQPIPHMGWNRMKIREGAQAESTWDFLVALLVGGPAAYFAHSYVLDLSPGEEVQSLATTRHGREEFASVVCRSTSLGLQFHPEKSGSWGLELMRGFVREVQAG